MDRKRPAVAGSNGRDRDGRVYRRLAAWARCNGFRQVTRHTIHHWVTAGLLPLAQSHPIGFGQRTTALHVSMGRQLLALCRYRYLDGLGRYDLIGAQLWLDQFEIADEFLRSAIGREFSKEGTHASESEEDELSFRIARQSPIITAMPTPTFDERAEVIEDVRLLILEEETPSHHGIELIARASDQTVRETARLLKTLPRVTRGEALDAASASAERLLSARAAFSALSMRAAPDRHKKGRTRARIRLAHFIAAYLIDRKMSS